MHLRIGAIVAGLWSIIAAGPVSGQINEYGLRDPRLGTITDVEAFTPAFNCPGMHLSRVTFTSLTISSNFTPVPWVTAPRVAEFAAGESAPSVQVQLDIGQLSPGKYQGLLSLECVGCDQHTCVGQKFATYMSIEIPYPLVFGASSADAQFGGLVNGQPVSAQKLLPNVLADIKKSSFATLPGATTIFKTLDENYLDNDSSDVTFAQSVDNTNPRTGRLGVTPLEVNGISKRPGNAAYTETPLGMEEIFLGVDMSTLGIQEARANPSAYYVFTIDGQMGVINKADLVHNLVHEGLHAAIAGKMNVPTPKGGDMAASIEEEQEGFRVGNAAAAALGLPPESTVPQSGSYNAGSNPAYVPIFPTLVPAAGGGKAAAVNPAGSRTGVTPSAASQPGSAAGSTPGGGTPEGAAPDDTTPDSGEDRQGSGLLPSYNSDPASGFCSNSGAGLACDGAPNFALNCDESSLAANRCTLAGTGIKDPCSFIEGVWLCDVMPPSMVSCSDLRCDYDPGLLTGNCQQEGSQYRCVQLPAFEFTCASAGKCSLGAPASQPDVDCLTDNCARVPSEPVAPGAPDLFVATQSLDCNKAGSGNPMLLQSLDGNYADSGIFYRHISEASDAADDTHTLARMMREYNDPLGWIGGSSWQENFETTETTSDFPDVAGEPDPNAALISDVPYATVAPFDERLQAPRDPFEFMFVPLGGEYGRPTWPGSSSSYSDAGADQGPFKGVIRGPRNATGIFNFAGWNFQMQGRSYGSINFPTPASGLTPDIEVFANQQLMIGAMPYTSLLFEERYRGIVMDALGTSGIENSEPNPCRIVLLPVDPAYKKTARNGGGSWGQSFDDQWAIKRIGFTDDEESAWNFMPNNAASVVVAVIDTGLDWHHRDIDYRNIWRNEDEIPDNGIDDDHNGYIDDLIGWNFLDRNIYPWDFDGHGTIVAGIIAATQNDIGIAGIDPKVKIMVLKGVNNFGTTRASYLAEAIVYAVNNGARIVNISVGGAQTSSMEQAAIEYAHEKGVLIVAASGNDGIEIDDFGPAGGDHVLTVGATHMDDRAASFSNYGDKLDLVAPGVDVLSLRARYTDANYRPGIAGSDAYLLGDNYVGDDKRYIRVSGTSFSAPIVSGVASLMLSKNPDLSAADVARILMLTASDIELAGDDKYTGAGMVNAQAALSVDPDFSITAEITALEPVPKEGPEFIRVIGTINASGFKRAWMQIGPGENPGGWRYVGQKRKYPIIDGTLGMIPINQFSGSELWQVVINVEHRNGVVKRAVYPIRIK